MIFIYLVLGLIFGSFASVLVYEYVSVIEDDTRKFDKLRFLKGSSKCTSCHENLRWWNLIPVLSFIFQKGKCAKCDARISYLYPLLEILMMTLFLLIGCSFAYSGDLVGIVLSCGIGFFGLVIFFIDLKTMRIPSMLNWVLMFLGVLYGYFVSELALLSILIGGGIGFMFFYSQYFISKGKWVGLGDADLGFVIGVMFGPIVGMYTILQSYILGTLVLVPLMLLNKKKYGLKMMIPFGPFLVISLIFSMFLGSIIVNWYIQSFLIF